MPKSRKRKKATYTPPVSTSSNDKKKSPQWYVLTMLGLMAVGVIWVVVTYLTQSAWPIAALGQWNLALGFTLLIAGFAMTTKWH